MRSQGSTTERVRGRPREGRAGVHRGETARQLIRRAKQASRRRFAAEENICIVMEGICAEVSVADLCKRGATVLRYKIIFWTI